MFCEGKSQRVFPSPTRWMAPRAKMEYLPSFLFARYIFFKLWVSRKAWDEGLTCLSCRHSEDGLPARWFLKVGLALFFAGILATMNSNSSNQGLYGWNLTINSGICHFESSFSLSARWIFRCQLTWKTSMVYLSGNSGFCLIFHFDYGPLQALSIPLQTCVHHQLQMLRMSRVTGFHTFTWTVHLYCLESPCLRFPINSCIQVFTYYRPVVWFHTHTSDV